jgi:hypothetical protein
MACNCGRRKVTSLSNTWCSTLGLGTPVAVVDGKLVGYFNGTTVPVEDSLVSCSPSTGSRLAASVLTLLRQKEYRGVQEGKKYTLLHLRDLLSR